MAQSLQRRSRTASPTVPAGAAPRTSPPEPQSSRERLGRTARSSFPRSPPDPRLPPPPLARWRPRPTVAAVPQSQAFSFQPRALPAAILLRVKGAARTEFVGFAASARLAESWVPACSFVLREESGSGSGDEQLGPRPPVPLGTSSSLRVAR